MKNQPEEIMSFEKVYSNARKASTIPTLMEKGIGIFVELRMYGFDILQYAHKCGIHQFFEWNTSILPELIYQF